MRHVTTFLCVAALAGVGITLQAQGTPQAAVPLWPEGVPAAMAGGGPEVVTDGRIATCTSRR